MTTLRYLNYQKNTPVKANFTNFEKEFITELVLKHQAILENKRNDSTMCRRKNETWECLTEEFNNLDPKITKRTCKQLKKCWENLKTRAKKATLEMKSDDIFGFEDSEVVEIKNETLLDEAPKVADLIAMQLKPISDVIKPIDVDDDSDNDDDNNNDADNDDGNNPTDVFRTSSDSGTQTPVEKPRVVKKSVPIKVPLIPKITVVKPHTTASILTKLGVKHTSTVYKPHMTTSSVSTSSSIVKPVAPPKLTTPSASNPVLRHTLSTSTLERQLQEEEQRLKVQFLKRKLEMAEEEHQETLSLLRSKKQYVELKKQNLVQRGLEKSGISNDTSSGIQINSVVGNAKMNTSRHINGTGTRSTVYPDSDQTSDSNSSKDDNL